MLPFLEVTHLPSSSSFYSSVLQPLGLWYLSTESESRSSAPAINYGAYSSPNPLLQLHHVPAQSFRPSRLVLSAPSAAAVDEFHSLALRADPDLAKGPRAAAVTESCAVITDFDGNTMEVVYVPPRSGSSHGRSAARKTQSTAAEASRILDWNYDVAGEPYPARRSAAYEPTASPRQASSGLSTGTVVGTLLGVAAGAAAGAALTYTMVKNGGAHSPSREPAPPAFTRRSTFPEQHSRPQGGTYTKEYYPPITRRGAPTDYFGRHSQAGTARASEVDDGYDGYDDGRSRHSSRYGADASRSVRTRSEASSHRRPLLIADSEHRTAVSSQRGSTASAARSAAQRSGHGDAAADQESHVSSRSRRSTSTVRAGGPPPPPQAPARSRAASRASAATVKVPGSPAAPSRADSYVAARHVPLPASRADSYVSARHVPLPASRAPSYVSGQYVPLPPSRAGTHVSARHVPLPPSSVGRGLDDDSDSIAPSDSISCVGSRRSVRSHH